MRSSRRSFLQSASLAASASALGLSPFGALSAFAQGSGGYKALVCVFLYGGNDANNIIVPSAAGDYSNYAKLRGLLAVPQSRLLPLSGQSSLALHAAMPNVQALFNAGSAALVANVGSLVQPVTRAQFLNGAATTPLNLFSHEDQQTAWQTELPAAVGTTGWGGRIADTLGSSLGPVTVPMSISVSGAPVFGNGVSTSCMTIMPGTGGSVACSEGLACDARLNAAQQLLALQSGATLIQADDTLSSHAYSYAAIMSRTLAQTPGVPTGLPTNNPLKPQIEQILQVISARGTLGAQRQIFFASLGGFDTHGNQLAVQTPLLAQVDAALGALYQGTAELGLADEVTSFTMSEFGRALESNTGGGSDHAWGTHMIVVGGAVKGGQVYGKFPTLELGGADDAGANGRWIPTTSTSQVVATLAGWFGVAAKDLPSLLPCLGNFPAGKLGFL